RDGIHGWPEHAPYHRIIATCAVPRVPWSWAQQLTPGGQLLTDLKIGTGAGNLVLLHRHHDRLEGRFTGRWAAFMGMRHNSVTTTPNRVPKAEPSEQRVTSAPAQPWNTHREVWLLTCLALPPGLRHGYILHPATRTPKAATLAAPDGSWAEVDLGTAEDGSRWIREGGPTPLWEQVEHAHQRWHQHDQPSWDRFGLTVTRQAQWVWLDDSTDGPNWPLDTT